MEESDLLAPPRAGEARTGLDRVFETDWLWLESVLADLAQDTDSARADGVAAKRANVNHPDHYAPNPCCLR